jgi:hypothetical protein
MFPITRDLNKVVSVFMHKFFFFVTGKSDYDAYPHGFALVWLLGSGSEKKPVGVHNTGSGYDLGKVSDPVPDPDHI